jgi:hypothetical protein
MTTTTTEKLAATAPQMKRRIDKLPANCLGSATAEYVFRTRFVNLRDSPPGAADTRDIKVSDLLDPAFWQLHTTKLERFEIVRVVGGREGTSSAYDVLLTVVSKAGPGVMLRPYAYVPPGSVLAEEFNEAMAGDGPAGLRQSITDIAGGLEQMNG